jgi:hypothetical protein
MSGHADTLRRERDAARNLSEGITLRYIDKVEGERDVLVAENQQLRDALEQVRAGYDEFYAGIARAALAGTSSEKE